MHQLILIVSVRATVDKAAFLRTEFTKLVARTRQEEGCVQYDLHQDMEDPTSFVFYERWESQKHWQDHLDTPQHKASVAVTESSVEDVRVQKLTAIL